MYYTILEEFGRLHYKRTLLLRVLICSELSFEALGEEVC